ncbi:hypothetical protein GTQ43_20825 [Nostoc sp. KVJ3]|uniref:hypothetical protein n=1 Tax=Nostoc sp. KVJ3 TaxID=457945 RepID=UPI002238110A|nr:hypothetical protein [Nostoc sp. KVJ3]MCW5315632.1 hypothetical protein [Nostoc sp. KVJ3]MCW5316169.1 hypothetical protein [Nostoc sp. KVJ3]
MASNALGRDYFAILRLQQEIKSGKEVKPLGFFSCRSSTTRFLELQSKVAAADAIITFTRKKVIKRSTTLADGTTLTVSAADKAEGGSNTNIEAEAVAGVMRGLSKGSKSITLKTGKPITDGAARAGSYHTVSFRFPQFATNLIISNALGNLLNAGTVSQAPSESQIFPYFISAGGKRYPIATSAAATAAQDEKIATDNNGIVALAAEADTGTGVEAAQG